ncbi:30S ribosomal protein S20 [Candidatus Johnevansia muelleri]|uniref:Small ribosomal subunit protein bS20 n=1 Tax=Candidatus Johnevansia muelleri TaxID=1495769 RepID=A0A078KEQ7_9GAMM|nr:30S ribosomal protein S20 [Candidatus Evansia muelleri]
MKNIKKSRNREKNKIKKRLHNTSQRSMLRTFIKRILKAIEQKNYNISMLEFKKSQSILDRIADKDIISKKKIARIKKRIQYKIKKLIIN